MKNLIVFGACAVVLVVGGLNVFQTYSGDNKKAAKIVSGMNQCIEQEKIKGKGQDHLDSTYRICWIRAQRTHQE